MDNIEKKSAVATKWSLITELFAKLVSPVTNMILARLLAPEAFGAVATITMIITFAEVFTDAGFQKYIVQHEFSDDNDFRDSVNVAFWSNFTMSVISVVIIVSFRNQLGSLVGAVELSSGIAVASVSIVFVAFSSIQMAVFRRQLDFKTLFQVRMITAFIPLVVTVPLAVITRNYWALIIGTLAMHAVQAVILTIRSELKIKVFYSFVKFKEMFSFSAWSLFESVSIWLTQYVDTFIVGHMLSNYYLGLYKTAITTVNAYMSIITSAITPVLFSTLSKYQNDDIMFKKTYYHFQKMLATICIPMGVGMYVYSDLVTNILLGSAWKETSGFMGIWGLMSALTISISYFSSEVFRSKGKPNISLVYQIMHLLFLVPTIYISSKYGFKPLYISRSLIRIQLIIAGLLFLQVFFGFRISDIVKNIVPQTMSALIMGAIAVLLLKATSSLIWQIVTIPMCIVVYFVVLMCFPTMRKDICDNPIVDKLLSSLNKNN